MLTRLVGTRDGLEFGELVGLEVVGEAVVGSGVGYKRRDKK